MAKRLEKMTLNEAISMYMEEYQDELEAKRISKETDKCYADYAAQVAQRVAEEMALAWDQHQWDDFYANTCEEFDTEECIRQFFETEENHAAEEPVATGPIKSMKAATRRKQNARHKKRVRRNAINAAKNNLKRGEDDQMAESCRGGYVIKNPKSLTQKTDKVWKKAAKMKLVDEEMPTE